MNHIDIVFDGPPGPTAGRFVEVEDENGASIAVGEWLRRADGYWALRIQRSFFDGHTPKGTDPIGDKLRSLPIIGVINVDDPTDPRHKEWR